MNDITVLEFIDVVSRVGITTFLALIVYLGYKWDHNKSKAPPWVYGWMLDQSLTREKEALSREEEWRKLYYRESDANKELLSKVEIQNAGSSENPKDG